MFDFMYAFVWVCRWCLCVFLLCVSAAGAVRLLSSCLQFLLSSTCFRVWSNTGISMGLSVSLIKQQLTAPLAICCAVTTPSNLLLKVKPHNCSCRVRWSQDGKHQQYCSSHRIRFTNLYANAVFIKILDKNTKHQAKLPFCQNSHQGKKKWSHCECARPPLLSWKDAPSINTEPVTS